MIFAVIPAAGHSERMGRPKLALPLGDRTVLERVIAALQTGGVDHVLVVIGPHVPQLTPLAEQAGADILCLKEATPDMRATVEAGLRWIHDHRNPRQQDWLVLVPADHPTLDGALVRNLLEVCTHRPDCSLFVPTVAGKRGHPLILAWKHVEGMLALAPGLGLNTYVRQHRAETLEIPVASAEVLCDLDTPEEYENLRRRFEP